MTIKDEDFNKLAKAIEIINGQINTTSAVKLAVKQWVNLQPKKDLKRLKEALVLIYEKKEADRIMKKYIEPEEIPDVDNIKKK